MITKSRVCTIILIMLMSLMWAPSYLMARTGMVELINLTGARQVAMGETARLHANDPFNLEFNPASFIDLPKGMVGVSHNSFIQDRNTNTLAVIFPAKGLDFGVHTRLTGIDNIEGRGDIPTTDPEYLFSAHDFAAKAFAAFRLSPRLQAGVSVGYLMEKIDVYRASSIAFGLGGIYFLDNGLAFHASLANLGPSFTFISEDQSLPTIIRAGTEFVRNQLTLAADYVNIKSGDSHLHFGGEYLLQQYLFLRAGYMTGYDSKNFTTGVGFVYNNFRIDYAFVPYESDLGNSHRFTFTVSLR